MYMTKKKPVGWTVEDERLFQADRRRSARLTSHVPYVPGSDPFEVVGVEHVAPF